MRNLRSRAVLCFAAICGAPSLLHAESQAAESTLNVALDYRASVGCPEVDDFKGTVIRRLGYDPFEEGAEQRVLVELREEDSQFSGRFEWRDRSGKWTGEQSFPGQSNDCRGLARTMGLALAVQIHLLAMARQDEPEPTSPPKTAPSERPAVVPQPAPVQARREATPPAAESDEQTTVAPTFGVGAAAAFGLSSRVVPLARAFAGLEWAHWSLELGAELTAPSTTRRADGSGFSQHAVLAGLAVCGKSEPLSLCALAKGGPIFVQGRDVDAPASPTGAAWLAGLRLGVLQRLSRRTFIALRAEALANISRWTVTLDGEPVWEAPRLSETLGLDFGLSFR